MQGKFSDSSYFLIRDFFYEVTHSKYTEKPETDFKWDITFVSTVTHDDSDTEYTDSAFTLENSVDTNDILFTNFETTIFNLIYHKNPNIVNTSNSYIVSPFVNITTRGSGIVNLFVKEKDTGYTPISVKYLNTRDDRFNFSNNAGHTLIPGDTITTSISGAAYYFDQYNTSINEGIVTPFENNKETYWRKDSLFHEWLIRSANQYYIDKWGIDLTIRNYVNYDKIFLLFHKIFKSRDELTSRIIFYGIKNFVMDAIPEHQRTPKFKQFMDIFFDELYQENYSLLKEVWNMFDPMLVDRKYLGYLSKFYDMFDVDSFNVPELHLREFVRDMIWILKRKGTYTDFFILWRILTNTNNRMNIYERWHARNPAQWPEWPQQIDPNDTDTWPNYPYYMYDIKSFYSQSTPCSAWHFQHDLDSDIQVQVFDRELNELIPDEIIFNSRNDMTLLFDTLVDGNVIVKKSENQDSQYPSDIWVVSNSLEQKELVINFKEDKQKVYEGSLLLVDDESVATFEDNTVQTRNADISRGNHIFYQDVDSTEWIVNHNMGTNNILYNVYNLSDFRLIPSEFDIIDPYNVTLTFDEPQSGYIVLLRADKNNVVGTTNVPTSAWYDTIYTFKPEYHQDPITGGAGALWYKNNYPMTIEACLSDMTAQVTYVREGAFVYTKFEIESTIWELNHELGQKNVLVQIFDEDFKEIIPTNIFYTSDSKVIAVLPYETRGYAFVKKNDKTIDREAFNSSEWDIYTGFDNQDVISHYSNDDMKMYEKDTWLKDDNNIVAYETVYNNIFSQRDISNSWSIPHTFENTPHIQIFDDDLVEMVPSEIIYRDTEVIVEFEERVTGYAMMTQSSITGSQYPINNVWLVGNSTGDNKLKIDFNDNSRQVYETETETTDIQIRSEFTSSGDVIKRGAAVSPANYVHLQTTTSDTWGIYHQLSTSNVLINVYTFDNIKIQPSEFTVINSNTIQLLFDEPTIGYVVVITNTELDSTERLKSAFMLSADFKYTQTDLADVWTVPYTEEIKGFITSVYNFDDIRIHPKEYSILTETDGVQITFNTPQNGYVLLEEICNFIDIREDKKMMLSTHYIVEIDISDEPMDTHDILSESTWDDISAYWEYLRPVNRVADYRIVFSPITNFSGLFIPLYGDDIKNSDAYALSISEYYHGTEQGAYIHTQSIPSSVWIAQHNLGDKIHVQVFDDDFNEIIPYEIVFESNSVMKMLFHSEVTGFGIMKKADEYHIQDPITNIWNVGNSLGEKELVLNFAEDFNKVYEKNLTLIDYASSLAEFSGDIKRDARIITSDYTFRQDTPETSWSINHNLGTRNIDVQVFDTNNMRIFPSEYIQTTENQLVLSFDIPQAGYLLVISTNLYNQTIPTNIWEIHHNFNSHVNVQVFDDSYRQIVPSEIIHSTYYICTIIFDYPITGHVLITRTEEYIQQNTNSTVWNIDAGTGQQNLIIDFSENEEQVTPSEFELIGVDDVQATFETSFDVRSLVIRDNVLSEGNYIHRQNTPDSEWVIIHNLGIKGLVVNVYDMNDERIHPKEFHLIDPSRLSLSFTGEQDGYVVMLRVGNLTLDGFDFDDGNFKLYENEGDMINDVDPIYTSSIDSVIESDEFYYVEKTIPKDYEFTFNEIGIFNEDNALLFYTKCSNVYKPTNTLFTIHYRIEKTETVT